jgi:hypothetical protein
MLEISNHSISEIAFHQVGNKMNEESLLFTKGKLLLDEELHNSFLTYFSAPFKTVEYFNLYHQSDIQLNEVFNFVSKIFDYPEGLFLQSINLAKHLYECCNHPKIKGGEFYTVYFKDCFVDGITVDAVGLFKTENKDTFLKVNKNGENYAIAAEKGININKLDKGCLIYNTEKENGYLVAVIDNTNKGSEAQYWIDDFLHVLYRKDEYYNTKNVLSLCKGFITEAMPYQFEVSKAEQAEMLNKSVQFFKDHDNFDMEEFSNEIMHQPELAASFNEYKNNFQLEKEIEIENGFSISETALKKQAKIFKSVLKLDKNFHIYIHGNSNLIEKGLDPDGRKFYKIYFNEEN